MNPTEIMLRLESLGSAQTKKIFTRHGAREPFYGVKVQDLVKIVKDVKRTMGKVPGNLTAAKTGQEPVTAIHQLAIDLYATGNSDAMYLAGLMADPGQMDIPTLNKWAEGAYWYMLSEYTVANVAARSAYGWELGLEWIRSDSEMIAAAGWATLSGLVSIVPDDRLKISKLKVLIGEIGSTIHQAPNRVRYTMNNFLIATASYVQELTSFARTIAVSVGKVSVNVGETSCKVPFAPDYIDKVEKMGRIGQKRK